jgi:polyvinyl alcohol dehydrogenase (cytochrome)
MPLLAIFTAQLSWGLDQMPGQSLADAGKQVFEANCAMCHDDPNNKAPNRESLAAMSFDNIMMALELGRMQPQASGLDKIQKASVATFLAGDSKVDESWIEESACSNKSIDLDNVLSSNWGLSQNNTRYVDSATSGITKANVGKLKLKWSFAFPKTTDARSQPVLTKDTLFVGSKNGNLFALDKSTGCIKWRFKADSSVRSGLVLGEREGKPTLYFGDALSTAYAVDAQAGTLLWKQSLAVFPTSIITGSPAYHEGTLYVPISSYEIVAAGMSVYPCCRSHGVVAALDVKSGEKKWLWHGTPQATPQPKTESGLMQFGPSGVSVWSSPMIDEKRGVLYVGTAENLSHPATDTSDAVIALELSTGAVRWKYQVMDKDVWNSACLNGGPNCPKNAGGDLDIGASIILTQDSKGNDILLAGQKSGAVYGFDPDGHNNGQGKLLWKNTDTENTVYSPNPGVHWGMAVEGGKVYVPIADAVRNFPNYVPRPGLYALNIDDGKTVWSHKAERGCELEGDGSGAYGLEAMRQGKTSEKSKCSFHYSLSAAATTTDGIVFAGRLDGKLQAYDTKTGEILWETETARSFDSVNGIEGHGGAIDVDGPVIGDGMLFINSGYSMFGQLPGNVLLGFEVAD